MNSSQNEQNAGINISYENSFTAIKRDILKETVDKNRKIAQSIKQNHMRAPIPKPVREETPKVEDVEKSDQDVDESTPNKPNSNDFNVNATYDVREKNRTIDSDIKQK